MANKLNKNIKYRIANPSDIYAVRSVQKAAWIATYPNKEHGISKQSIERVFDIDKTPEGKLKMEKRKKYYNDKRIRIFIAEKNETIIGFCMATQEQSQNRIGAIYIHPTCQRDGIGSMLIKQSLNWLDRGYSTFVNVVSYNTQAIDFYRKHGFENTGKMAHDAVATLPDGTVLPEIEMKRSPNNS